jgi:hypothetical protein
MPLKTPFGLVMPILQSSITRNYNHTIIFLRCVISTQLTTTYAFVTTITYYTLALQSLITRSCRLTSQLSLLSPIETSLVELLVSNSRELLAPVSDRKTKTGRFGSAYNSPIGPANNASCCLVGLSEDNCLMRFLRDACDVTAAWSRNCCL